MLRYFNQRDQVSDRMVDQHMKHLAEEYKKANVSIRSQLETIHRKYSVNGELSYAEMTKYNRLANLQKDVNAELGRISGITTKNTAKLAGDVYNESFFRTAYALEQGASMNLGFGQLPTKQVEAAISNPYREIALDTHRQQVRNNIRRDITQGIIQGESYPQMAKRVQVSLEQNLNNAERIARTEAHRAREVAALDSMEHAKEMGVNLQKQWVSAIDQRTRDTHAAMDGQRVAVDEDFVSPSGATGPAPGELSDASEVINCFPYETIIASPDGIKKGYKRFYKGDLIEIITAGGVKLAATPNHPILTNKGWVPFNRIEVGTSVACTALVKDSVTANPDIQDGPTMIGEIFDFLAVRFPINRAGGVAKQFHGDGMSGKVDIVTVNGKLGNRVKTKINKPTLQNIFILSNFRACALSGFGTLYATAFRLLGAAKGFIRKTGKPLSFFRRGLRHPQIHGLTPATDRDTGSLKAGSDSGPCQIEFVRECLNRHSLTIQFDKIVCVNISSFSGHVYNLQSQNGYYLANAIVPQSNTDVQCLIVHNCRCTSIAIIEGFEPEARRIRGEGAIRDADGNIIRYDAVQYKPYREYAKEKGWPMKYDGPEPKLSPPGSPPAPIGEELAGVQQGPPRTAEEARGNYAVDSVVDRPSANPNFKAGNEYRINCQTTVVAHEARYRGFDVVAKGNVKGSNTQLLMRDTTLAWIDPTTGIKPTLQPLKGATTAKTTFKTLNDTLVEGQRYTMQWGWKGRGSSGHIVHVGKEQGKLFMFDPQSGTLINEQAKLEKYFGRFKYSRSVYGSKIATPPKLLRVDDKTFNSEFLKDILEKG